MKNRQMTEPVIKVGILTARDISFRFTGEYRETVTDSIFSGDISVVWQEGYILFGGQKYHELSFLPSTINAFFTLPQVTIGIDFHWERQEQQSFKGCIKLLSTEEGIILINEIAVEEYLISVISSEMSASATKEFLKAHAVISRSWLLAQLEKNRSIQQKNDSYTSCVRNDEEMIRWYDREDHTLFDVCADDHCQRYQGITHAWSPLVKEVIEETKGEILSYNKTICDARFSKCCGGVSEEFEYCWEPVHHPYLTAIRDSEEKELPDLTIEKNAIQWIQTSPDAFCNTREKRILEQVLNNYDQETTDFYRWKVSYTAKQLSELILRKSGLDFGVIEDIIPLRRGKSGRLEKMKIIGSRLTYTIGKELEIRRTLSESHLYSSAFIVEKKASPDHETIFTFTGAGWGHGVGLCQIGAAVMGDKGYSYKEILFHYFKGTEILTYY